MTSLTSILRVTNLLRTRSTFFQELSAVYRPAINRNREKIMELIREKVNEASKSELARKIRVAKGFYKVEMTPPTSANEIERLKDEVKLAKEFLSSGCYRYLTVKQALLLFLVGLEISLWFYLGETLGKFHLVGYKV